MQLREIVTVKERVKNEVTAVGGRCAYQREVGKTVASSWISAVVSLSATALSRA